jgi:hypothetical protein
MNEAIRDGIMSGEPFMTGRFGGFEVFAMQSAEFDDMEKMKRAIDFLDKSAGFFPKDENLLYRFNDIMKEACTQIDILGCWLVNYEDYYIRHYCRNIKSVGKLMAIEPWNVMEKPWSESLEGKSVQLLLQARRSLQDFLNLTYFILNLMTMHGAVQDLQEQSLRLSSIWVLREQVLRMLIRS